MKDSRDNIRTLWLRQRSGESLDAADRQRLQQALRDDGELRRELSDDATSHALLTSLEDVPPTDHAFVQAVMQRVQSAETASVNSPAGSGLPSGSALPSVSSLQTAVDGRSEETPAAIPAALPTQQTHDQRAGDRRPHGRQPSHQSRRQYSGWHARPWFSVALTCLLFLAAGLFFRTQDAGQPEIAETEQPSDNQDVVHRPEAGTPSEVRHPTEVQSPSDVATSDAARSDVARSDEPAAGNGGPPRDADSTPQLATTDDDSNRSAPQRGASAQPDTREQAMEPARPLEAAELFATLTQVDDPVWEREDTVGSRLGGDVVRLFGGTIELTFDDGAIVTLKGPVEFQPRDAGLLDLRRGQLSATVPQPAIGFTVTTPTSEVVDLGTEFDVSVKDSGASDVVIRKGEVEVTAGIRNGNDLPRWKLVPGELNRASFLARPDNGQPGPIVGKVQGAEGQFRGFISMNGKTARFLSEDTFNSVHERVQAQLKNSQDGLPRQWQDFVDSMSAQMRGTMNLNGRQMPFGNLDEVMRLHNELRNPFHVDAGTPLNGSININGKVIRFQSREEYEAARRAAFGPAADFGAGDLLNRPRGSR